MKKIIGSMLLLTICFTAFAACGDTSDHQGSAKNKIVIGLDENFPPMGFRDEKGEIVGFDIDLAKEAGKKMNLDIEFRPIDWASKELELSTGKIDAVWNGLSVTEERKESMLLSKSYMKNRQVILVKDDGKIKTKQDLSDKNVGVQKESASLDALNNFNKDNIVKEIQEYPDNISAFIDLDIGRIDAVVVDEIVARYYIEENNVKFIVLEDGLAEEEYAIAMKKGNTELKEKIDKALEEMNKDGSGEEISKKWFGENILLK